MAQFFSEAGWLTYSGPRALPSSSRSAQKPAFHKIIIFLLFREMPYCQRVVILLTLVCSVGLDSSLLMTKSTIIGSHGILQMILTISSVVFVFAFADDRLSILPRFRRFQNVTMVVVDRKERRRSDASAFKGLSMCPRFLSTNQETRINHPRLIINDVTKSSEHIKVWKKIVKPL